ncbi:DUF3800 domain-containing protein [Hoeflea sp. G2-23]|uniref:DUF3800 domain-containing protein n=1 Tax=Hoeflea algicola TaxID=2983763 RepID=A0ABT3ZB56_9HYPH|nr:DUF3800 domain-containing protein [Hoeflea algicola]
MYVDESSQTKHDFLVLGGVICRNTDSAAICESVMKSRLPELPFSELKWTKVSNSKLPAYKRVADFFFDSPMNALEFHSLVVPMRGRSDRHFNGGSSEIGFNKEIYQLLMKCGKLHSQSLFHIYPDYRKTNSSTEELRLILNRGARKRGDRRDWPYRRVHFRQSHDEPLIQLADIFSGAIAFINNKHHLAENASASKVELAAHIFARAKVSDPTRDTFRAGKFTIWHRQLKSVPRP